MVFWQLLPILVFIGNDAFHLAAEGQVEAGIASGHRAVAPDRSTKPHIFTKVFHLGISKAKILRASKENERRLHGEKLLGVEFNSLHLVVVRPDLVLRAGAHVGEEVRKASVVDHALGVADRADSGIPTGISSTILANVSDELEFPTPRAATASAALAPTRGKGLDRRGVGCGHLHSRTCSGRNRLRSGHRSRSCRRRRRHDHLRHIEIHRRCGRSGDRVDRRIIDRSGHHRHVLRRRHHLSLLRRSRDRLGAAHKSPLATAFKIRRLLNSFEKDGTTEDRYKNHMEQEGDREIP